MISAVVTIFRSVVIGLFALAVMLSLIVFIGGGAGFAGLMLSLGVVIAASVILGISAVLLSINDRLGTLIDMGQSGGQRTVTRSEDPLATRKLAMVIIVVLTSLIGAAMWSARDTIGQNAAIVANTENAAGSAAMPKAVLGIPPSTDPMCDPKAAATVGLRCAEKTPAPPQ